MHQKKKYTLCFHGKCSDGYNKNDVIHKFAALFGVNISDVEEIFSGDKQFVKMGLNAFTVRQYQKAFSKIGAVSECLEQTVFEKQMDTKDSVSTKLLLKRNKQKKKVLQAFTDHQKKETSNYQGTQRNKEQSFANKSIQFGVIYIICIFLVDSCFQLFGVDIGYKYYIFGSLFFVYGGRFIAKSKGYSSHVGLISLTGLLDEAAPRQKKSFN